MHKWGKPKLKASTIWTNETQQLEHCIYFFITFMRDTHCWGLVWTHCQKERKRCSSSRAQTTDLTRAEPIRRPPDHGTHQCCTEVRRTLDKPSNKTLMIIQCYLFYNLTLWIWRSDPAGNLPGFTIVIPSAKKFLVPCTGQGNLIKHA